MLKTLQQSVFNKVRDYTNPFNLLIPWLNAIFKKYMGTFFNEEIKKEQFTTMGLQKLTLKVNSINQLFPPNMPYILESGSVALLKLDLHKLTCLIEEVELTMKFKTLEQYRNYSQSYQKQQSNAARLQKIKEDIIKACKVTSETNKNQNAWNIIRQFLQKITFTVNKCVIHLIEPENDKLSIAINQISMRVRKLQEEKDQMVSTMIIGGCSLHINEKNKLFDFDNFQKESCIFSLQQKFTEKYDQHVVIHLRTELKDRLKFNSTLSIKLMQLCLNYEQFQITLKFILKLIDQNKFINSQDKIYIESIQKEPPQQQFTWCKSQITIDYWDKVDQKEELEQSLSDGVTVEFNDELKEALEKSQFNDSEGESLMESQIEDFNQSQLYQSNLNQSTFKQSIFSVSVFKELINDEDDKQGLDDLDDGLLIFKLKLQKIRLKLSQKILKQKWNSEIDHPNNYFQLEIDLLNWLMTKELSQSPTTIKQTNIEIKSAILYHFIYLPIEDEEEFNIQNDDNSNSDDNSSQDLFQSIHNDDNEYQQNQQSQQIFHSCYNVSQNDIMEQFYKQKQQLIKEFGKYYYKQNVILSIYSGEKCKTDIIIKEGNKFIFNKNIHTSIEPGIKIRLDHLNNSQAITVQKVDISLNLEEIIELIEIFQINIENRSIKTIPNLNLITIHQINIDLLIQEPNYLEFYFISKQDPQSSSILHSQQKLSFLTIYLNDFQLQQQLSGLFTYDQLLIYKKEYDKSKKTYYSELIGEIGQSKNCNNQIRPLIKITNNKDIKIAIPLIEFYINIGYIEYIKQLILIFQQLGNKIQKIQQRKQQQQQIKQINSKKIIYLIDELIIKINIDINQNQQQTRFIFHASKLSGEIFNQKQFIFNLYNCCVIDTNWYLKKCKTDIPIYGSPTDTKNDYANQMLHFRNAKYSANQILFYKQERFNREGFKTLIQNEVIKSDEQISFQHTQMKLKASKYLNPDCLEALDSKFNLLKITMENNQLNIIYQHGIIQIDESWIETITTLIELFKKWEQEFINIQSQQKNNNNNNNNNNNIKFNITLNNIWMNYLPTYRKSTLLKSYLMKKDSVKKLIAIQPEQLYYSWIRLLIRIKSATISSDMKIHLSSAQIYVKSTSKDVRHASVSFLNPILLIPPQTSLYDVNRKISDGFQIDKDEQGLLRLLCFQKLFKIKGVTLYNISQQQLQIINIGQISGSLKKDSIIGLWDITQMTLDKVKKLLPENTKNQEVIQNGIPFNKNINIFEEDDIELPCEIHTQQQIQFKITLQSLEIKLTIGQHFPPEIYSDPNPVITEFQDQNQEIYFLDHSNLTHLEEFPQEYYQQETDQLLIIAKELKIICCGQSKQPNQFFINLLLFEIQDQVQNSKFSKLYAQEIEDHEFLQIYYQIDNQNRIFELDINLTPSRICLSGATLEFLFDFINSQEQLSPKLHYLTQLNVENDKESVIECCVNEGYQVEFSRPSELKNSIQINSLDIERIYIAITFDGSGVKLDGKLKGLVRMASYDNLVIFLKRGKMKNILFEKESEFITFLFESYENLIKNDKVLLSQFIMQFKALNNITNIFLGIQTMFVTMFKQGLFVGVCSGSIPLVKALGDEILYLAKKPIEVCGTVTEAINLKMANKVFSPIEKIIDKVSAFTTSDKIPKKFLK